MNDGPLDFSLSIDEYISLMFFFDKLGNLLRERNGLLLFLGDNFHKQYDQTPQKEEKNNNLHSNKCSALLRLYPNGLIIVHENKNSHGEYVTERISPQTKVFQIIFENFAQLKSFASSEFVFLYIFIITFDIIIDDQNKVEKYKENQERYACNYQTQLETIGDFILFIVLVVVAIYSPYWDYID